MSDHDKENASDQERESHRGHNCPMDPEITDEHRWRMMASLAITRMTEGIPEDHLIIMGTKDPEACIKETMKTFEHLSEHVLTQCLQEGDTDYKSLILKGMMVGFYIGRVFEEQAVQQLHELDELRL